MTPNEQRRIWYQAAAEAFGHEAVVSALLGLRLNTVYYMARMAGTFAYLAEAVQLEMEMQQEHHRLVAQEHHRLVADVLQGRDLGDEKGG